MGVRIHFLRRISLGWSVLAGASIGGLLAVVVQVVYFFAFCNFHTVLPGEVYRCAQPSAAKLEQLIRAYGIRTVVNMRSWEDADWYREEQQVARKCEVAMADVPFWGTRLPSVQDLRGLVDMIDHSSPPLLIHCYSGADRTGLASAMYLLLKTDCSLAEAHRQLSLVYGHVSWGQAGALDKFLDMYADWLREQGREHSAPALRWWMGHVYCP
jgi:protein tyrosine phosphatase (PTP) superfamily phosphohydrolase (DUF442 family)